MKSVTETATLSRLMGFVIALAAILLAPSPAAAQFTVPSDGSDGVLNVTTADIVIDLGLASTGAWNSTPVQPGSGVYDPDQWIVVFKYQSVNIASGRTVKFKNHPKNPPVVWLVQGDVVINGTLNLNGEQGQTGFGVVRGRGGPGGFSGGVGIHGYSCGFGPDGGLIPAGGAFSSETSVGRQRYGSAACFPLIGGSGSAGSWGNNGTSGGGGGGAILIASATRITVGISNSGGIYAEGGAHYYWNAGSGGMIRLVAPIVDGSGRVSATSGSAFNTLGTTGRVRVETHSLGSVAFTPMPSLGPMGNGLQFLRDTATPRVRVVSVNGNTITADPAPFGGTGSTPVVASSNLTVVLECANVPANATVTVRVNAADQSAIATLNATFTSGNTALSTWTATGSFGLTQGAFAVQARAVLP